MDGDGKRQSNHARLLILSSDKRHVHYCTGLLRTSAGLQWLENIDWINAYNPDNVRTKKTPCVDGPPLSDRLRCTSVNRKQRVLSD
jgi:hypothetical protein